MCGWPAVGLCSLLQPGSTGCRASAGPSACWSPASASCTSSPPLKTWPPWTPPSERRPWRRSDRSGVSRLRVKQHVHRGFIYYYLLVKGDGRLCGLVTWTEEDTSVCWTTSGKKKKKLNDQKRQQFQIVSLDALVDYFLPVETSTFAWDHFFCALFHFTSSDK